MSKIKPYVISKHLIWEAYKNVKAKKGAGGVDNVSLQKYEENLKDNLYKLWNRMSSGSYFPKPVKAVSLRKSDGGERVLGIPCIEDRIAQMAVVQLITPLVEPIFHKDSYGYRPNKSALDAVTITRERCWRKDWVIDLDIKSFFDSIDHELMMRMVEKHVKTPWILLYIERWLKSPMQNSSGELIPRDKGTPQGGVISPLLANIFMDYVFDVWLSREFPDVEFARYADDIVVHTWRLSFAKQTLRGIQKRFERFGLQLHPEKTEIVYCKGNKRQLEYEKTKFDFLGFTFRPRVARNREGEVFVNFLPAVSDKAKHKMQRTIRSWRLHMKTWTTLENIAAKINPIVRGWLEYYGRFQKTELTDPFRNITKYLMRWVCRKYTKILGGRRAKEFLGRVRERSPKLFVHWQHVFRG